MKSIPQRLLVLLFLVSPLTAPAAPTAMELAELFLPPQIYNPKLSLKIAACFNQGAAR